MRFSIRQFAVYFIALLYLTVQPVGAQGSELTLPEYLTARLTADPIIAPVGEKKTLTVDDICAFKTDPYARKIFAEYGAMFAARSSVSIPWKCIFDTHDEVAAFQKTLRTASVQIDGVAIDLQAPAMDALAKAAEQAAMQKLRIIPLDGAIAGRRSYNDTVALWSSRFYPALDYWSRLGKIAESDADEARKATIRGQVDKVVQWEADGYLFGTGRTRSIFSSTAPPGTSQHLSMIAIDVRNYADRRVKEILAENGWYQTIINDPTHFTYLGVSESELASRGLMTIQRGQNKFWVPRF